LALSKDETIWLENYKLLIEFVMNESKLYWDRYNVFLALNSGLLVALVFLAPRPIFPLLEAISIFGISLGIIWFLIVARASAYIRYWIKKAREIEEDKLQQLSIFKEEEKFRNRIKWYEKAGIIRTALVVPILTSTLWFLIMLWTLTLN